MQENSVLIATPTTTGKSYWQKYRKVVIITVSVTILQLIFGFDPKFCIINIVWLLV
jgi:hypothetical protein